jgi:hypothetical protein
VLPLSQHKQFFFVCNTKRFSYLFIKQNSVNWTKTFGPTLRSKCCNLCSDTICNVPQLSNLLFIFVMDIKSLSYWNNLFRKTSN